MPLAATSLTSLRIIQESSYGAIPVAGPARNLRFVGETLDYMLNKEDSGEINSSRMVTSQGVLGSTSGGGISAELSYQEYDGLIAAALQSTFDPMGTAGVTTTFTADLTATTLTAAAAPTGSSAFTRLKRGQWFKLNAPSSPANNGKFFKVSDTVAPTATVVTVSSATPFTVGSAIANCTLSSSRLTQGSALSSFAIERINSDISEYWAYTGQAVSALSLSAAVGQKTTIDFTFVGAGVKRNVASNLPAAGLLDSYAYEMHTGPAGPVAYLLVDNAPLAGTFVQGYTLNVDNKLRALPALNAIDSVAVGNSTADVKGTLDVYFANGALFDKYIANTPISISMTSSDAAGNGYSFTLPRAALSKVGGNNSSAKDQEVILKLEFTGLGDIANADATLRKPLFIDRIGAAAT